MLNGDFKSPYNYTFDEVKDAFSNTTYDPSEREKNIYNKFFKEFSPNEIDNFCNDFGVNKRDIKKLYKVSPYRKESSIAKTWDDRFRLNHSPIKITPRNHDKYLEIDNFNKYELTPCIAYEIAIRNPDIKKLLDRHKLICEMLEDDQYKAKRYFTKRNYHKRFNHPFIEFRDEYKDLSFEEYENLIARKHKHYHEEIEKDYKGFIDNYIYMCTELGISFLSDLQNKIEDELQSKYLIYAKGYIRNVPGASFEYKEKVLNSKKKKGRRSIDNDSDGGGWQIRFEEIIHDEFIQVQGVHLNNDNDDDEEYFVNNIIPNFNRQVNDQNQINIPINFSLPIGEIVEYIKKVKKKINPKTPLELLEEKLKKADDLTNINAVNDKNKELSFDIKRGEKPQEKLADLFYIYDMREIGFPNTEIIYELDKNYPNKKTAISENTIKKYYTIAKDYIVNERYKELITGKKSK